MTEAADQTQIELLRVLLAYEPDTGLLHWTEAAGPRRAGKVAGTLAGNGYIMIRVGSRVRLAHRIAYALKCGRWPQFGIDHLNRDRADNRWDNLRDVPHAANSRNHHRVKLAQLVGAVRNGDQWDAVVFKWGAAVVVGTFTTAAEANAAYLAAQREVEDPKQPRPKVKPPKVRG